MFDSHLFREFSLALKNQGKQKQTVESYVRDVKNFVEYLASYTLELNHLEPSYLVFYQNELLKKECGENSIRRGVIGIRQFFRFLVDAGHLTMSPFDHVAIPPRREKIPRLLLDEDVDGLFEAANDGRSSLKIARDLVIMALLAYEGLKASEVISLKRDAFLVHKNLSSLKIDGPKSRVIALSSFTTQKIVEYLEELKETVYPFTGSLVVAFRGKDLDEVLPQIGRHGLKFSLYELGLKAGIEGLNSELLRHYAINRFLTLGFVPAQVMQHLGLRRVGNIAKHLQILMTGDCVEQEIRL